MKNFVLVKGRPGADPVIKNWDNGGKSAQFNLAVKERGYKRQDGTEVPERTDWLRMETGNSNIAGIVEKYVRKGELVEIVGKLKNRDWEKDGVKHYLTVVVIEKVELCPKNGGEKESVPPPEPEQPRVAKSGTTAPAPTVRTTGGSPEPNPVPASAASTTMGYDEDLPF
jgi:single-strand DNA-binding protein